MIIREDLLDYIKKNIFSRYESNKNGHGLDHILYVINRSLNFASKVENINMEMVYVIAAYHDIGHSIDPDNHEKVSADILRADQILSKFFSDEQIEEMSIAVEDHRASSKSNPRTIYGEIVSSADRNTDVYSPLRRTFAYRYKDYNGSNLEDIIKESFDHISRKFGIDGYASKKMFFEDKEYDDFLSGIRELISDKDKFVELYLKVNGLNGDPIEYENSYKKAFREARALNPNMSTEELLRVAYEIVKKDGDTFEDVRNLILDSIQNDYPYDFDEDYAKRLVPEKR